MELKELKKRNIQDCKICLYEHEDTTINELKQDLEEIGLRDCSIVTDDGLLAFKHASKNDIDILVSDYKMPKEDGITFLENVREVNKNLVLVLYTGYTISPNSNEAKRIKRAGIKVQKKIDGVEKLVKNLKIYINEPNRSLYIKSELTESKEGGSYQLNNPFPLRSITEIVDNSNIITATQGIGNDDSLKELVLELAKELVLDLEKIENRNAIINVGNNVEITIDKLLNEVKSFSPIGKKYLTNWFKAERTIRKFKKK